MKRNIIILVSLLVSTVLVSAGLVGCGGGGHSSMPLGAMHEAADVAPTPVAVKPFAMGQPDLVLLITGRTSGMLEVCNCRGSDMPGGLSRRSGMFVSYRKAFPHTVAIDGGDFLYIDNDKTRNEYLLRAYAILKYDALVMGDQELGVPQDELSHMLDGKRLPLLSTNVDIVAADSTKGAVNFASRVGTPRVAVLSAVDDDALKYATPEVRKSLKFNEQALAQGIEAARKEGRLVVVVAHGGDELTDKVAAMPGVGLVIRAHTAVSDPKLRYVKNVPVVKVGGNEYVGAVAIKMDKGTIKNIEYRLETVDTHWPMDTRTYQVYQAYAAAEMRRALDAERKTGLDYVTSATCGECHKQAYASWQKTRHAHAYKTLTDANRQGDPNCLMCHTSGFGTAKGFYTIEKTPQLANVNCQDCHRFNVDEHRKPGYKFAKVDENICTTCHTPVTAPNFNYDKMSKLVHPK